ncbi:MAG TPA: hypothetical protein VIA64_18095 [Burkholderiales bacterium]|jgi:hypothetical protein
MKLKTKTVKRAANAAPPRAPAPASVARKVRGQDLGDRRLQLLLGAVR